MPDTLLLDPRLHKLIKEKAIQTIPEALIELITNSYDACRTVEEEIGGSDILGVPIKITSINNCSSVTVKDDARGLTSEEIENRLLKVGSYTANDLSRGLMGRGAKDITALGDVNFKTIRHNKFCELLLKSDDTYEWIHRDIDTSPSLRQEHDMMGNGFSATLIVDEIVQKIPDEDLPGRLSKNVYLRNMITEGKNPIVVNGTTLIYKYPLNGKEIVNIEYEIEGYPDVTATFVLYSVIDQIPNPKSESELEYGVLVSTSKAVHECGGLMAEGELYNIDYRWNKNLKFVYGELRCDYIDVLARETSEGMKNVKNPYLILDPDRRDGLTKRHPFTVALYDIPYRWLSVVLNRIQDLHEDTAILNDDVASFLGDVSDYLQQHMSIETVQYTWRSKSDQENLNAMVGKLKKISVDKDIINLGDENLNNLESGDDLVPIEIENTNSRPEIQIKISDDPEFNDPFDVQYFSDRTIIKINANDDSLTRYTTIEKHQIEGNGEVSDIKVEGEGAMVAINDILREAIVHMLTRQTIMSTLTPTNVNSDNYNEVRSIQSSTRQRISTHTRILYDRVYNKYH